MIKKSKSNRKEDGVYSVQGGWKLNGEFISHDPRQILSQVLSLVSGTELVYWSEAALVELYKTAIEVTIDAVEEEQTVTFGHAKAGLTRSLVTLKRRLKYLPTGREGVLYKIYETLLSTEGLGLLHGFGFSNRFGDKLKGNSEVQSVFRT